MRHIPYIIVMLLLFTRMVDGQETTISGWTHALDYTPWQLSGNPAGITQVPIDSLVEARIGYGNNRQPLSLSDQPKKEQTYGASANGFCRFGRLQLSGGLSWNQARREDVCYNLLLQPDYIVAAGDTLGGPQRIEEYGIYGKAAYRLTPSLTAGIGGDYKAASNKDDQAEKRYEGDAHTTRVSLGLIYETKRLRTGVSARYTNRTELLSYNSSVRERLYTYPLGYYLNMNDFNITEGGGVMRSGGAGTNYVFRSTGNQWEIAAQAEWLGNGWSWFNTFTADRQKQKDNPKESGSMKGWEETFTSLHYQSRLTLAHGRWTHRLSPSAQWKSGLSDRILQHINYESLSSAWETYATYRLASRTQISAELRYEVLQDYTPTTDKQAWVLTSGWYRHEEKFHSFPMTITQTTATIRGTAAYRYTFALPRTGRLALCPSFTFLTGYGTEEAVSQPTGTPETVNNLPRSRTRVSNDYAARTATRLLFGLQAEYRRAIFHSVSAGLRLSGGMEQLTGNQNETKGNVRIGLLFWL